MRSALTLGPDQYHTFTARLSAGGLQTTTMRVVAVCILSLGVPAALAAADGSRATTVPGGQWALATIGVGCVALAAPWFGHRWPTRAQSAAVVLIGTLALAVGCLLPDDPRSGLLVAASFPMLLGYTALFHSSRLLLVTVTAAAVTIGWLTVRIAATSVAIAVALAIPVILLCTLVTFGCRTIAALGGSHHGPADIDPLTGLLTRTAFYENAATLLGARNRDDDRFLAVFAVTVDGLSAIAGLQGARAATAAAQAAAGALRDTVRRGAVLGHVGGAEFLIADTFTTADPDPLVERARGAIATTPMGLSASIGVVTTALRPLADRPPYEVLDEVIALATTAMFAARGAGGDQARFLLNHRLAGDDDPHREQR